MSDHEKIDKARQILKLGETATIPEIKEAFRSLSIKFHPDKCEEKNKKKCEEKFKEINNANEVLVEYCLNYRFPFKEMEEAESLEEEHRKEHLKRFYDGWWGDLDL